MKTSGADSQASGEDEGATKGLAYRLDFSDAVNHYVVVTMQGQCTGDTTTLMMATWTPGSYLVREYARRIDRIEATDGEGNRIALTKTTKNRWQLDTSGCESFEVRYRLFCNDLTVRTNWVSYRYGVLNGAATYLTVPERMAEPHEVTLQMPDHWQRSATSLRPVGEHGHRYRAADYDELVDNPIVAGHMSVYPFRVAGVEHQLVNVNENEFWDGNKIARDLAAIVKEHQHLWQTVPYDRYLFINIVGGGGGGLEHDNCCLIMSSRWSYQDPSRYERWLGLVSHEFFHTWNVRRLRPKALVEYDYENEVYTPSLWVAEGVTSYYQGLLLARGGLISTNEYLQDLARSIRRVQTRGGRKVQSLRNASHDAWIKFYRRAANSRETQVSYYTKGSVVAFLLDVEIRAASDGEHSLDDALRRLYREFAGDVGYTPDDFRRICSEVAGTDLTEWFESTVDSTDELDYKTAEEWFGLVIEDEPDDGSNRAWLGIGEQGSPASSVGIGEDDEILAVDGIRLRGEIGERLEYYEPGDRIQLLISRDGVVQQESVSLAEQPSSPRWTCRRDPNASEEQEARLKKWLGSSGPSMSDSRGGGGEETEKAGENAGENAGDDQASNEGDSSVESAAALGNEAVHVC